MRAWPALLLVSTGCLRATSFPCERDDQCTSGGTCQPNGFCSFADASCASGQRFGEHAGAVSEQCVDEGAPVDAHLGRCAASYAPLPGAGPHVYRRIATGAAWATQRTACAADGYLVIPDDGAELGAVLGLAAAAEVWLGISDLAVENTFVTVRNTPATYLPWEAGEPNDEPGVADCVRAKSTGVFADDQCIDLHPAVCECDP